MKRIKATIIKIEGANQAKCSFGHQVGDEFIFNQYGVNKPLCLYAQAALQPAMNVLMHNGSFSWLKKGEPIYWGCSHPGAMYEDLGQVIFHLEILD